MENYNQIENIYIARINSLRRYEYLLIIVLIGVFGYFFTSAINQIVSSVFVIIIIASIILVLLKVDVEDRVLAFEPKNLVYRRKGSETIHDYKDLTKIEFIKPFKNRNFVKISLGQKSLKTDIERIDGLDLNLDEFMSFIWSKNDAVEILDFSVKGNFKFIKTLSGIRRIEI